MIILTFAKIDVAVCGWWTHVHMLLLRYVTIMVIFHPMWLKPAFRIIAGYKPAYSLSVLYLNAQNSISDCFKSTDCLALATAPSIIAMQHEKQLANILSGATKPNRREPT